MGYRQPRLSPRIPAVAAAALVLLGALVGAAPARAACADGQVEIRTPSGQMQRFTVELADDPDERARGLMFRDRLAMSAGMLFVFPEPKTATFWMKNTPLSLDILFADQAGVVTRVEHKAEPQSTTLIDGGPGVAFVLEINGGLAEPMGIAPGAELRHSAIDSPGAAWPCAAP